MYYAHFQIKGDNEDEIVLVDYYRDADFTVTTLVSAEAMMAAAGITDIELTELDFGAGDIASYFEDTKEFVEVCENLYEEALKKLEDFE